mgnify:CR=1 FL=1
MPNQRRSQPVRRSSGSGDVFIPVIIILLGITILSLLIAFVWQKWQDKYDPDYLYPDSRPSSSQSESSSEVSEPSSSEESSSEPESSAVQFGQPVPESERVTSAGSMVVPDLEMMQTEKSRPESSSSSSWWLRVEKLLPANRI